MPTSGRPAPVEAPEGPFLTAAEAAQLLRIEPITAVRLCREGKIPATKPFGTWLIAEADLKAILNANRNERGAA